MRGSSHCCRRRMDNGHGREILLGIFERSGLVGVVVIRYAMLNGSRRRPRSPLMRDLNQQSFMDCLSSGIIIVQCPAHLLLRPKYPVHGLLRRVSRTYAQRNIGCVENSAQRICVLFENGIPHIIHQVVLLDLDQRSRGIWPLDPNLPMQHACVEWCQASRVVFDRSASDRRGGL